MSLQCRLVDHAPKSDERKPGDMWFMPWYYNPEDPEAVSQGVGHDSFFSIYYRTEYFSKRAPLAVACPDGSIWVIDQISSNGAGWQVTGDAPIITCNPSILVPNYHGFLQNGIFTDDLEGRTY